MRKLFVLLTLIILVFSAFVPLASAQTTPTESAGCTATDALFQSGVGPYTFGPYEYLTGEKVVFSFAGAGDSSFSLSVNGSVKASGLVPPTEYEFAIPANGSYTFEITVTNGTIGNSVSTDCLSDAETPDYTPGTICHIPPGNPNAAHTITVGLPAVDAHLGHGDTEGPCPEGTQTRYDDDGAGITIFIIYATGEIQVYGNCDDAGECQEVTNVPIVIVINFNIIVVGGDADDDDQGEDGDTDDDGEDGEFVEVDNPEDYAFELPDTDPNDGLTVVIYYLHPDPNNPSVGVFQINIYKDGVLVDDNVLLFITTDGTIVLWTDQSIWERQFAESQED